jgi:hypothetical protein
MFRVLSGLTDRAGNALVPQASTPPAGFVAFNGHYYGLTKTAETWTQAEAEAEAMGGHLVAITSQAEENFLINQFVTGTGATNQPYWMGFYDANYSPNASNRDFVWTTGEPVSYTDWNAATNEPNNNGGQEWYGSFNFHYGLNAGSTPGTWNDTTLGGSVAGPYYGLIELNPASGGDEFRVSNPPAGVIEGDIGDNTIPGATPLPMTEAVTGSGFFTSLGLGTITDGSDADYWRFDAEAGDRVTIRLETNNVCVRQTTSPRSQPALTATSYLGRRDLRWPGHRQFRKVLVKPP